MAYTKSADGIAKKGRTDVKVFPNSGPTASNPQRRQKIRWRN